MNYISSNILRASISQINHDFLTFPFAMSLLTYEGEFQILICKLFYSFELKNQNGIQHRL